MFLQSQLINNFGTIFRNVYIKFDIKDAVSYDNFRSRKNMRCKTAEKNIIKYICLSRTLK